MMNRIRQLILVWTKTKAKLAKPDYVLSALIFGTHNLPQDLT